MQVLEEMIMMEKMLEDAMSERNTRFVSYGNVDLRAYLDFYLSITPKFKLETRTSQSCAGKCLDHIEMCAKL